VPYVTGGDGRLSRRGDACDLHIADLDAATQPPSLGGDSSRRLRGSFVEWSDAPFEILLQRLVERLRCAVVPP